MKKKKVMGVFCRDCKKETNHILLFSTVKKLLVFETENSHPSMYDHVHYMTIECAGCGQISFLQRTTSDFWDDVDGNPSYFDNLYPIENKFNFLRIDEQDELTSQLTSLYDEVKKAFLNNSNLLSGLGLRTLVEAICLQQKVSGKNLQDKIKNLQTTGLISISEVPILDKLRQIGNFSAHQIKAFPLDKLEYALDIVNHVLRSIYILPKINKRLKI